MAEARRPEPASVGWIALALVGAGLALSTWTWSDLTTAIGAGLVLGACALAVVVGHRGSKVFSRWFLAGCFVALALLGLATRGLSFVTEALVPLPTVALEPVEAADYLYLRHPTEGWLVARPDDTTWIPLDETDPIEVAMRMTGRMTGRWAWIEPGTNARLVIGSFEVDDTPAVTAAYVLGSVQGTIRGGERPDLESREVGGVYEAWTHGVTTTADGPDAITARALVWRESAERGRMLVVVARHHPDDPFDGLLAMAHAPRSDWLGPGLPPPGFTTPTTSLRNARVLVPRPTVAARPVPGTLPPAVPPFEATSYPTAIGPLPGYLALAPAEVQRGAVLWLHGPDLAAELGPDGPLDVLPARGVSVLVAMVRGEPGGPGAPEAFLGEVDDARGALQYLSARSGVLPERIVVAGHENGATLALLLAESGVAARGYVCIGPHASLGEVFGPSAGLPVSFHRAEEAWVRSPLHFVAGIRVPTLAIAGLSGRPDQIDALTTAVEPMVAAVPLVTSVLDDQGGSIVPGLVSRLAERIEDDGRTIVGALAAP